MFPLPSPRTQNSYDNRAICVSGVGATKPFSVLITDTIPDLELVSKDQCFTKYWYENSNDSQAELLSDQTELERHDNITDTTLKVFRTHYGDNGINKDDIFDYVYGVLHAKELRDRFANNLAKELPRVPFAPDFHTFSKAGRSLADIHLGYEHCQEFPLQAVLKNGSEVTAEDCILGRKAMKLTSDGTELVVNEQLRLTGIPPEAHEYEVNGRTPLGWLIDRYKIVQHKESNIVNDPNGWFDDPRDLIKSICRIVHVSVETASIVSSLPCPFPDDKISENSDS